MASNNSNANRSLPPGGARPWKKVPPARAGTNQSEKQTNSPNKKQAESQLCEMFDSVLDEEVIVSVASSFGWNVTASIEALMEIAQDVDTTLSNRSGTDSPRSQRNSPRPPPPSMAPRSQPQGPALQAIKIAYQGYDDSSDDADVLVEEEEEFELVKSVVGQTWSPGYTETRLLKQSQSSTIALIHKAMVDGVKVMVVMRGMPGSGKSHLARKIIASALDVEPRSHVFSSDDFFCSAPGGGYVFAGDRLPEAHNWNQARVQELARQGFSPIVVDNTHTQAWEMKPYLQAGVRYGYQLRLLEPDTPWAWKEGELVQRNQHGVPRTGIRNMIDRYERYPSVEQLLAKLNLAYAYGNAPPQQCTNLPKKNANAADSPRKEVKGTRKKKVRDDAKAEVAAKTAAAVQSKQGAGEKTTPYQILPQQAKNVAALNTSILLGEITPLPRQGETQDVSPVDPLEISFKADLEQVLLEMEMEEAFKNNKNPFMEPENHSDSVSIVPAGSASVSDAKQGELLKNEMIMEASSDPTIVANASSVVVKEKEDSPVISVDGQQEGNSRSEETGSGSAGENVSIRKEEPGVLYREGEINTVTGSREQDGDVTGSVVNTSLPGLAGIEGSAVCDNEDASVQEEQAADSTVPEKNVECTAPVLAHNEEGTVNAESGDNASQEQNADNISIQGHDKESVSKEDQHKVKCVIKAVEDVCTSVKTKVSGDLPGAADTSRVSPCWEYALVYPDLTLVYQKSHDLPAENTEALPPVIPENLNLIGEPRLGDVTEEVTDSVLNTSHSSEPVSPVKPQEAPASRLGIFSWIFPRKTANVKPVPVVSTLAEEVSKPTMIVSTPAENMLSSSTADERLSTLAESVSKPAGSVSTSSESVSTLADSVVTEQNEGELVGVDNTDVIDLVKAVQSVVIENQPEKEEKESGGLEQPEKNEANSVDSQRPEEAAIENEDVKQPEKDKEDGLNSKQPQDESIDSKQPEGGEVERLDSKQPENKHAQNIDSKQLEAPAKDSDNEDTVQDVSSCELDSLTGPYSFLLDSAAYLNGNVMDSTEDASMSDVVDVTELDSVTPSDHLLPQGTAGNAAAKSIEQLKSSLENEGISLSAALTAESVNPCAAEAIIPDSSEHILLESTIPEDLIPFNGEVDIPASAENKISHTIEGVEDVMQDIVADVCSTNCIDSNKHVDTDKIVGGSDLVEFESADRPQRNTLPPGCESVDESQGTATTPDKEPDVTPIDASLYHDAQARFAKDVNIFETMLKNASRNVDSAATHLTSFAASSEEENVLALDKLNNLSCWSQMNPSNLLLLDEMFASTSRAPTVDQPPPAIPTADSATNTCHADFALLELSLATDLPVLSAVGRCINQNVNPSAVRAIPSAFMLDKGCSTSPGLEAEGEPGQQHDLDFLLKLFPAIPREDLTEVFDKCQGEINWTVDLLLESGYSFEPSPELTVRFDNMDELHRTHSLLEELNARDYKVVGDEDKGLDPVVCKAGAVVANVAAEVNEELDACVGKAVSGDDLVCSPSKKGSKKQSRLTLQLKKQMEEHFTFRDDSYSDHVNRIRKIRHGDSSKSDTKPDAKADAHERNLGAAQDIPEYECHEEEVAEEDRDEEVTVPLTLDPEFCRHLQAMFGEIVAFPYAEGVKPVVELPVALARQIHGYLMESQQRQLERQEAYFQNMIQDEKFARRLQEEEMPAPDLRQIMDMEVALELYAAGTAGGGTKEDMATRLSLRKLREMFPAVDGDALACVFEAHHFSFADTVEVLEASTGGQQEAVRTVMSPEALLAYEKQLMDKARDENDKQRQLLHDMSEAAATEPGVSTKDRAMHDAQYYRDEATRLYQLRNECFQKANSAPRNGMRSYYAQVGHLYKERIEEVNALAASALLLAQAQGQRSTTLDLHCLYVAEALEALDIFLDHHIAALQESPSRKAEALFVITGSGIHSVGGRPRIKPAVQKRLARRQLRFTEVNSGLLKVVVTRAATLSNDAK